MRPGTRKAYRQVDWFFCVHTICYAQGMTSDTPAAKRRGRPKGSGQGETPIRHVRMGPLWERGKELADQRGMTMTALVEEALRREIARLERAGSR